MEDKEIFYSNLLRKNRWLGLIDYKSLMFLVIYIIAIINIVNLFNISFEYKIYIDMFLIIPVIVVTVCVIENESVVEVIKIIIKYSFKNKIYYFNLEDYEDVDIIEKFCSCK